MKTLIVLFLGVACTVADAAFAANYSTEATMTRQKDKGQYEVTVSVSRLTERDGEVVEELIQKPRITTSPGVPASLYTELQPPNPEYTQRENVTVDVTWPKEGRRDFAVCTVTVKLGARLVSRTKLRIAVDDQ